MAATLISSCLQESLSSASRIPTDIKFIFREKENGVKNIQEISAHKFILALVSDVFHRGCFGDFNDDGNVEIKDVSRESFMAMINFIYNVKTDMNNYDCENLCSLYYLADKYNINALKKEVLLAVSNKNFPAREVPGVGVLADLFSVHEELAEALQVAVSRSLSNVFEGDLDKLIDFFNQIDLTATPISSNSLIRFMANLKKNIEPTVCRNCKSSPCISGMRVTRQNFVTGAKIYYMGYEAATRVIAGTTVDKLLSLDGCGAGEFRGVYKNGAIGIFSFDSKYFYSCNCNCESYPWLGITRQKFSTQICGVLKTVATSTFSLALFSWINLLCVHFHK